MKYKINLVLLFVAFYFQVNAQLPTELPNNIEDLEIANKQIAEHFAPTIHQLATGFETNGLDGYADLITAVDYDGDFDASNNWENLESEINDGLLKPKVYYSVVWTNYAWIITYGFYHPRDYSSDDGACCSVETPWGGGGENHENDFEGTIFVVSRIDGRGNTKFNISGAYSISHHELKEYIDMNSVPEVFIDNETHAVELNLDNNTCILSTFIWACDGCAFFDNDHVIYSYNGGLSELAVMPTRVTERQSLANYIIDDGLVGNGSYALEDIFTSQPTGLYAQRYNNDLFIGNKFNYEAGDDCTEFGGTASAPWGWDQFTYENGEMLYYTYQAMNITGWGDGYYLNIEHNPYFPIDCGQGLDLVVSEDLEMQQSFNTMNTITVESGVELTIKDIVLRMDNDGQIILKPGSSLIVDNARITGCNSNPTGTWQHWDGIVVEAGSELTTIDIKNGSVLEYANRLITNTEFETNPGLLLPVHPFSIGGKLNLSISDSYIENNDLGIGVIEDGTYSTIDLYNVGFVDNRLDVGLYNKGKGSLNIDMCSFSGSSTAVSLQHCNLPVNIKENNFKELSLSPLNSYYSTHIQFEKNTVKNCTGQGIRILNSTANIVNNNVFENNHYVISASGTFPMASLVNVGSLESQSNQFYNNYNAISYYGIDGFGGTNPSGGNIENNAIISSAKVGIQVYGQSDVTVKNNTIFDTKTGMYVMGSGSDDNLFMCNEFFDNHEDDVLFESDNFHSLILQNDFVGNDVVNNIRISSASLETRQGYEVNPADNCFEPEVLDLVTEGSTSHFDYYHYEQSNGQNCEIPHYVGIYTPEGSEERGKYCPDGPGSNFVIDPIPPIIFTDGEGPTQCDWGYDSLWVHIGVVKKLGGDDPTTVADESTPTPRPTYEAYQSQVKLDRWIKLMLYRSLKNKNYACAIKLLKMFKTWKWQIRRYGVHILAQEYNEAEQVLNSLANKTDEERSFIRVQQINLDWLKNKNEGYKVNDSELKELEMIAKTKTPSAGYAWSLYFELTGEQLDIDISLPQREVKERSKLHETKNNDIAVFPNPVKDRLFLSEHIRSDYEYLKISDANGRKVYGVNIVNLTNGSIDMSTFGKGVYFIELQPMHGVVRVEKVIKL